MPPPMRFSNGVRLDETTNRPMRALAVKSYDSESTGQRNAYTATLWSDGRPSCNCRGWATHHATKGDLCCKHARDIMRENGIRTLTLPIGDVVTVRMMPPEQTATCGYEDRHGSACTRQRNHDGAHTFRLQEVECTCGPSAISVQRCPRHGPSYRESEREAARRRRQLDSAGAAVRRFVSAHVCVICGQQFLTEREYRRHSESAHRRNDPPDDPPPPRPERRIVL